MYSPLIIFIVFMILPAFGIGPIISRGGRSAQNNPVWVTLPEDAVSILQDNYPPGRKAQEVLDLVHRWMGAWLLTSPIWITVTLVMNDQWVASAINFFVIFLGSIWTVWFGDRFHDAVGHGYEIKITETNADWRNRDYMVRGKVFSGYRDAEIERMRLFSSEFRGMTHGEISEYLKKISWAINFFALWFTFRKWR